MEVVREICSRVCRDVSFAIDPDEVHVLERADDFIWREVLARSVDFHRQILVQYQRQEAGANCKFTLKEGAGSQTAIFEGSVTKLASSYTVLYPYRENATIDAATGKLKGVSLKGEQTAVKGSFDPEAGLMAAKSSEGNTIAFKNVVGYVKLVCGFDCTSLIFGSNSDAQGLAGSMDITFDKTTGTPAATVTTGGRRGVSLTGNIEAGTEYYIASSRAL